MNIAKEILELESTWNQMDSGELIENVRNALQDKGLTTYTDTIKELSVVTQSTKHTVEAWINSGRKNVKIPFLKLCMIAVNYDIDIYQLLNID